MLSSKLAHIPGDLLGGLTAAIVALPIALAFGVASGLGAPAGIYGAIACGILAALFGGTKAQVSGPTGPMTVVVAAMVSEHLGHPEIIFAAIILAGVCQVGLGLLKAGQLIEYIPYPVVSGFMSGIGMIIIILQLRPLVGLPGNGEVLATLQSMPEVFQHYNTQALGLGLLCLACIYVAPIISKRIPAALLALIVGTSLAVYFRLEVPTIAQIPAVLPLPKIPWFSFSDWHVVITNAFALATLGSIDSLLTSVVVDRLTRTKHDSNKELIGQGIGNFASGLIGGLPGAGATMRSVINIKTGATTRLSGFTHGVILLAVLLGLGSFAQKVPLACLAAILISVGISIIDYRALKLVRKAPKEDMIVLAIVLLHTIFVDLIIAVIAGLAVAALLFAKKMSDTELMHVDAVTSVPEAFPVVQSLPDDVQKQTFVYSFHGPLFFGEVTNLEKLVENVPEGAKYVILHFANVPFADLSGAFALQDAQNRWTAKGIDVIAVKLSEPTKSTLSKVGVGFANSYDSVSEAVAHIAFGDVKKLSLAEADPVDHDV
jgi:SulP family sulfate permease